MKWIALVTLLAGMACLPAHAAATLPLPNIPQRPPTRWLHTSEYYEFTQANRLVNRGNRTQALSLLQQAHEKNPNNLLILFSLGEAHLESVDPSRSGDEEDPHLTQAALAFERLLNLDRRISVVYLKLGKIALLRGNTTEAKKLYRQGVAKEPFNPSFHFNLAGVLEQTHDYEDAIHHYRQAIRFNPGFVNAYNNLGLALEKNGQRQAAVNAYRTALRLDPAHSFARLNLGSLYAAQNEWDKAERLYKEVFIHEPQNAWAHFYLGNLYYRQERYEQAIAAYQEAIQREPSNTTVYYLLTLTLYKAHRLEEAVQVGMQYMSLAPVGRYSDEVQELLLSLRQQHIGGSLLNLRPSLSLPMD